MARRRFFVNVVRNGRAEVAGNDAHHLTRVLRVEAGQRYEISDGAAAYLAEVTEARKDRVVFQVLEGVAPRPQHIRLTVGASLVKFDHFEWLVEKATELGTATLTPVEAARCERGLFEASHKRVERWRKVAFEAAQQSRRDALLEIGEPTRLADFLSDNSAYRFLCDEEGPRPILTALPERCQPEDTVALLVGPEGGWKQAERDAAIAAGWAAVSLGPQILRAETAAMAAVAILSAHWEARR